MRKEFQNDLTILLTKWSSGDQEALEELFPLIYSELRNLAKHYMRRERSDHTLQATALVNEAYMRLLNQKRVRWQNRNHFFAVAASIMRRILVDHARKHRSVKRGWGIRKDLLDQPPILTQRPEELLALDSALNKLASIDERKSKVVELHFLVGLTLEETAQVLKVSRNTVIHDWNLAKAWLYREIAGSRRDS